MKRQFFLAALVILFSLVFFSCVSTPSETMLKKRCSISRKLLAKPVLNENQLVNFFMREKPFADKSKVQRLAHFYIEEAKIEGINSDCAFAQMCHETGFLSFGNLVLPEMNNYCGLGAMDAEHPGEWFETECLGVRAHIQHIQAYATSQDVKLKQELVDPRYSWVHKAKFAETIFDFAGTWATDKEYGIKLDNILSRMEKW